MRIGLQDTDWEYVGAILAGSGSDEQLKFFKSFIKECLSWGTNHQVEMQLAEVNKDLSSAEREILGMLGFDEKE